jgi:hypothetical protein
MNHRNPTPNSNGTNRQIVIVDQPMPRSSRPDARPPCPGRGNPGALSSVSVPTIGINVPPGRNDSADSGGPVAS